MHITMRTKTRFATLAAIVIALWQLPAYGVPKAAENEDAPVVIAPDVPRPRPSTPPRKKEVSKKKAAPSATKMPHKPASTGKKLKSHTKK